MAGALGDVFLQLTVILSVAVVGHFIIRRFGQPTIIGEIGIGVVLGPSIAVPLLRLFDPTATGLFDPQLITLFATLGAIFLLFQIGLEMDVRAIYRRKNILVAVGGVVLPWIGGFLIAYWLIPETDLVPTISRFVTATFVGATLVATSTAIAAAILLELKMMNTEVATTIMGAVIVDDILGLMVLSISLGIAGGTVDVVGLATLIGTAVAFIGVSIYLGRRIFARLVVSLHARALRSGLKDSGFMLALAIAFAFAFLSEALRLSAVVGAFLAGAMFSGTVLRKDFQEGVRFLGAIFTPVFFISLGLLVDVWTLNTSLLLFGGTLLVVAFITKFVGCGLTAQATGMSRQEGFAVGYGMVPRGEVGLIIAVVAQQQGVIGADLFSIIVAVMIVVSVLPAPLLRRTLLQVRTRTVSAAQGTSRARAGDPTGITVDSPEREADIQVPRGSS